MNILLLSAGENYTLGASYKRAFEALGHSATLIDPLRLLGANVLWINRVSRRLLERRLIERFCRGWLPSLLEVPADLVWVGKGAWAVPWLWTAYKAARPKTKLVCYNPDDPITSFSRGGNRPWVTDSIGCFDLYCTYKTELIELLRQKTCAKVAHIPFGWDPTVHPMLRDLPYMYDLVFLGNGDAYREKWLTKIVEAPCAAKWKVAVFGSWGTVRSTRLREIIKGKPLFGAEMASTIAQSKVSLNILRRQNEGSHNMRTFEAPGCGGLTASQYSKEQDAFFPQGEAAIYFSDFHDATMRLNEAIRDNKCRDAMRARASEIVAKHTYFERAERILNYAF